MTIDVNALELLPAEAAGLRPCAPVTCPETCALTCSGCFTSYTRNDG
ncbi:ALQxL family class IV lanthipeptide [Acrocarpospora catenulata]|nr:ALQxL family class IV lanthipeptide [Acrocarpospora catenulata]